ncbi:MAG TPA: hypothetical protein VKW04_17840 [Planctomycetota bacterium]|nr:hypothetical protein [Planctomycetota bacterium]
MNKIIRIAAVVTGITILGGCSSASAPAPEKPATMAKESGGFYAEESYKGRLYVFGTEKAHKAFKETQQVPSIAKSYIGAGPEGQTLVLEADAKATDLQERLKAEYESRHTTKLP